MVFLKELFENTYFEEKISRWQKSMQNYPVVKELKHQLYQQQTEKKIIVTVFFIFRENKACDFMWIVFTQKYQAIFDFFKMQLHVYLKMSSLQI